MVEISVFGEVKLVFFIDEGGIGIVDLVESGGIGNGFLSKGEGPTIGFYFIPGGSGKFVEAGVFCGSGSPLEVVFGGSGSPLE